MTYKFWLTRICAIISVILLIVGNNIAQAPEYDTPNLDEGKTLFRNQCATCHAKDMKTDATGPALGGVEERWAEYPEEDLFAWIRNSQAMIADGHPKAVELWNQWQPTIMNNFLNLTDQEIANLLGYIQGVYDGTYGPKPVAATATEEVAEEEADNTLLFVVLAAILGILAVILARIVSNLNYMVQVKEGASPGRRKTLVEILTSKGVIAFVIFALVVLGGYTTVNNAMQMGKQQGYQPDQPIKFSHATHSGLNKIDCQYCHSGARRSKHSVIPPTSTCMNCHSAIKVGSKYGTAELTKIYVSAGYDPSSDQYVKDYENLPQDEVAKIFKKWIADTYVKEGNTEGVEEHVEDQWEEIVASLTNKNKKKLQGPIEWVRIHNTPDHAYFNHAQHVSVGKIECQTCHGPIQEMEKVQQYAPLGMGWCINCHRQTEVQFEGNEYYKAYAKYHEEIANGERKKVTVEDIGGLECQKCHY